MNVAVVRGRLSRPAEERVLASGARLVTLDVTVVRPGEKAESVPVTMPDPPAWVTALDAGVEVLAVGRVRRRFFRAGGGTASRTEVVATGVAPVRQAKKAAALVDEAVAALTGDRS